MINGRARAFLLAILLAAAARPAAAQHRDGAQRAPAIELRRGLVLTSSVRIVPKTYRLSAPVSSDSAVIVIRGDNITVDFAGATLSGSAPGAEPDEAHGIAIRVDSGRNVTIRNAKIRGYKIAILARGTRGLDLLDNDLSYNWKPRLYSLIEHESLADWLSHHHNEHGEWMRFGAAAYLSDVTGGEVRGNRAVQGMEGLMLVRSDSLRIWNNTFSFNSGVGIGLYRSSSNVIMHNRVDYDVRGYSHGFYARGQDSADLLIYEQSDRNIVAYNSMTHGGDGLFLWAGQSTMDTGLGGSNDNLIYGNDFSFAPANGMEATFSRNTFARNRVVGADYGMWAGYSFESTMIGNEFTGDRVGIAVEHGQANRIVENRFNGDTTAIQLWAGTVAPSDWQYPRHHDTRSRGYAIERNAISGARVGMRITNTIESTIADNRTARADTTFVMKDTAQITMRANDTVGVALSARAWPPQRSSTSDRDRIAPPPIAGARSAFGGARAALDRSAIIVNEWGPYDWRSPLLWPVDSSRATTLALRVLGPPGTWRVVGRRGITSLNKTRGAVGDTLRVGPSDIGDWTVDLEYRGGATVAPRGTRRHAGVPYRFTYKRFEPRTTWDVRFFAWSDSTDPRTKPAEFAALVAGSPVATQQTPRLDYLWYRPTVKNVPQSRFALDATARLSLRPGIYTLRTISDDAVRVWVDGTLAIDSWAPHESLVDVVPLTGGTHDLRVQYYQVDGWTELRLDILAGRQHAGGSPGPH